MDRTWRFVHSLVDRHQGFLQTPATANQSAMGRCKSARTRALLSLSTSLRAELLGRIMESLCSSLKNTAQPFSRPDHSQEQRMRVPQSRPLLWWSGLLIQTFQQTTVGLPMLPICLFLKTNVEHLPMCLSDIHISFGKASIQIFCPFILKLLFSYYSVWGSLYILETSPLSGIELAGSLSQAVSCLSITHNIKSTLYGYTAK